MSLTLKNTIKSWMMLWLMCVEANAAQLLQFEGKALDPKTKQLLYSEQHKVVLDATGAYVSAYVEYLDPEGKLMAQKTLDFEHSQTAPAMMFHDKRSDQRITVSKPFTDSGDKLLRILIEGVEMRDESFVEMSRAPLVIDGGFDRLIALNWDELSRTKDVSFEFLAVTRAQLFSFEVVAKKGNNERVTLELHPRNFFINLLVDPITLEYDVTTKYLMRFEGLSNIEKFINGKPSGNNYLVDIHYQYQPLKAFTQVEVNGYPSRY